MINAGLCITDPRAPLGKIGEARKKKTISNGESGEEGSVHRRDKRLNMILRQLDRNGKDLFGW